MSPKNKTLALLFFSLVLLATTSCNNQNAAKDASVDSSATKSTTEPKDGNSLLAFNGYLDDLYIDSFSFTTAYPTPGPTRKLVLLWTFGANTAPTLHGWKAVVNGNRDTFATNPDLKLLNGKVTTVAFGPGTYFGNEILTRQEIMAIKTALAFNKAQSILFRPTITNNQITYSIYVVKGPYLNDKAEFNALVEIIRVDNTALNPSPPRRYTIQ